MTYTLKLQSARRYSYLKDIGVKVVEMKYKNSAMSMFVFLPDSYDGLAKLQTDMSTFNYTGIIEKMREAYVSLSLPKFEIDFSINLKQALEQVKFGYIMSSMISSVFFSTTC